MGSGEVEAEVRVEAVVRRAEWSPFGEAARGLDRNIPEGERPVPSRMGYIPSRHRRRQRPPSVFEGLSIVPST